MESAWLMLICAQVSLCFCTAPSQCDRWPPVCSARWPWPQLSSRLCTAIGWSWGHVCTTWALGKLSPSIPHTREVKVFPSCAKCMLISCKFRWILYAICLSVCYWPIPKSYWSWFYRGKIKITLLQEGNAEGISFTSSNALGWRQPCLKPWHCFPNSLARSAKGGGRFSIPEVFKKQGGVALRDMVSKQGPMIEIGDLRIIKVGKEHYMPTETWRSRCIIRHQLAPTGSKVTCNSP